MTDTNLYIVLATAGLAGLALFHLLPPFWGHPFGSFL